MFEVLFRLPSCPVLAHMPVSLEISIHRLQALGSQIRVEAN